jgi:hypothetical protein
MMGRGGNQLDEHRDNIRHSVTVARSFTGEGHQSWSEGGLIYNNQHEEQPGYGEACRVLQGPERTPPMWVVEKPDDGLGLQQMRCRCRCCALIVRFPGFPVPVSARHCYLRLSALVPRRWLLVCCPVWGISSEHKARGLPPIGCLPLPLPASPPSQEARGGPGRTGRHSDTQCNL